MIRVQTSIYLQDYCDLMGRSFEVPVDFLPMSPDQVSRTGLRWMELGRSELLLCSVSELYSAPTDERTAEYRMCRI